MLLDSTKCGKVGPGTCLPVLHCTPAEYCLHFLASVKEANLKLSIGTNLIKGWIQASPVGPSVVQHLKHVTVENELNITLKILACRRLVAGKSGSVKFPVSHALETPEDDTWEELCTMPRIRNKQETIIGCV